MAAVAMPRRRMRASGAPFDGAVPPVSGGSGVLVGSGVGVNAAGAPAVPTATVAGMLLTCPQTSGPDAPAIRTVPDRICNEPSESFTASAMSEMFERAAAGSGRQTFAAPFNA